MNTIDVDTAARHCPSREWDWKREEHGFIGLSFVWRSKFLKVRTELNNKKNENSKGFSAPDDAVGHSFQNPGRRHCTSDSASGSPWSMWGEAPERPCTPFLEEQDCEVRNA
jgi:hypothetical protein